MSNIKLTYKELADMTGWTLGHTRNFVRQKRWNKTKPNKGKEVLIDVDLDELKDHQESNQAAPEILKNETPLREQIAVLTEKLNSEINLRELEKQNFEKQIELQKEISSAERKRAEAAESERDIWKEKSNKGFWSKFRK
ncbi:hypothetical protein HBA92_21565 [Ochrobactrum sp. MR28]|nr:hypothetical protein [Ochrobactrum sp. MR28]MBX8818925.1 hypothetical protein [Ochrobactrum sp. MR31]